MAKVYFQIHGCSANLAESEMMMGLAENAGNKITDENNADVLVINICTVKGDAKALKRIKKLKKDYPDKKLIVAGCIPKQTIPKIKEISAGINLINTYNIKKINEIIEKSIHDESLDAITYTDEEKIGLPRFKINPCIGIIPISSGCLSNCTFCSVKQIKGNLRSYAPESILKDIKISLENGAKEIWLTSQDNGCYGFDIGTNLVSLVGRISHVKGDFKIRIGMASPQHLLPYLSELINVMKSEKVFRFIHLPVQSGNNDVLKAMKRDYSVEIFKEIIDKIQREIPDITLSTDIICGFPTETEKQFDDSLRLVQELKFDVVNISRYHARPNTISARLKQISGDELKNRTRKMAKVFNVVALERNRNWIGWKGEIIIDEKGILEGTWVGRNYAYKPVVVRGDFKIGDMLNVKITDAASFDLRGEI